MIKFIFCKIYLIKNLKISILFAIHHCNIIMSETKLSKSSQNEDDKKDYEAVEMLKTEDHDDNIIEEDRVSINDSKNQLTIR